MLEDQPVGLVQWPDGRRTLLRIVRTSGAGNVHGLRP
jgi:hypothetical protein